jgi:type VI protein secretion system component Hcp
VAVDIFLVIPPNPATPQISRALTTTQDQFFLTTFPTAAIFEVTDFEFAVENPTVAAAGGGAGAGKIKFDGLVIQKPVDNGSPVLFTISASGEHFAVVQLYIRNSGAGPSGAPAAPYLGYEFQTVFITNIGWSGGDGSGTTEAVTFAFGAMAIAFGPTNPDGSQGQVIKGNWSELTNAANVQDTLDVK